MALKKELELPNGVVMTYHRVSLVTAITNEQINIEVASYISEDKRKREKANTKAGLSTNVLIEGHWYIAPYREEGMSVHDAYEYLKTLPEFEGSEDVWDDDDENV